VRVDAGGSPFSRAGPPGSFTPSRCVTRPGPGAGRPGARGTAATGRRRRRRGPSPYARGREGALPGLGGPCGGRGASNDTGRAIRLPPRGAGVTCRPMAAHRRTRHQEDTGRPSAAARATITARSSAVTSTCTLFVAGPAVSIRRGRERSSAHTSPLDWRSRGCGRRGSRPLGEVVGSAPLGQSRCLPPYSPKSFGVLRRSAATTVASSHREAPGAVTACPADERLRNATHPRPSCPAGREGPLSVQFSHAPHDHSASMLECKGGRSRYPAGWHVESVARSRGGSQGRR